VCLTEAEEEHVQHGEETEGQADGQKKKRNTTGKKPYYFLKTRPAIIRERSPCFHLIVVLSSLWLVIPVTEWSIETVDEYERLESAMKL
jgi:hypothetical protein